MPTLFLGLKCYVQEGGLELESFNHHGEQAVFVQTLSIIFLRMIRKNSIQTRVKSSIKEKERLLHIHISGERKTAYESLVCIFSLLQTRFWKNSIFHFTYSEGAGNKLSCLYNSLITVASLELIRNFAEMLYLLENTNERRQKRGSFFC